MMEKNSVLIEETLNAPAEKVWAALTQIDQLKQWYFDFPEFKPEVGFEFQFYGGDGGEQYLHLCKIIEVIEEKKLEYSWRYDGIEGISYISFELFPENERTRLTLAHIGLATFPKNHPDFKRENFEAGWTEIIGTSLKDFVEI